MLDESIVLRNSKTLQDIQFKGRDLSGPERHKIQKALRTFHNLEIMAVNIYRAQISGKEDELNRHLIAAMCNEITHMQDFATAMAEYGMRPHPFRWIFWIAGMKIGLFSKWIGRKTVLKTGIWVENKAVHHYAKLLETVVWDDTTRQMIKTNQKDERIHINQWKGFLFVGEKG